MIRACFWKNYLRLKLTNLRFKSGWDRDTLEVANCNKYILRTLMKFWRKSNGNMWSDTENVYYQLTQESLLKNMGLLDNKILNSNGLVKILLGKQNNFECSNIQTFKSVKNWAINTYLEHLNWIVLDGYRQFHTLLERLLRNFNNRLKMLVLRLGFEWFRIKSFSLKKNIREPTGDALAAVYWESHSWSRTVWIGSEVERQKKMQDEQRSSAT